MSVPPIQKKGNAQNERLGSPLAVWSAASSARGAHHRAVGVHDALGVGAGTRRVGDLREVARHHLRLDRTHEVVGDVGGQRRRVEVDGGRPAPVARARDPDPPQERRVGEEQPRARRVGEPGHAGLEHLEHVATDHRGGGDQRVDVADAEHLADLGRPVGGRERHHQRADAARGQPRDDPLGAVGEEQTDPGAFPQPRRQHERGDPA